MSFEEMNEGSLGPKAPVSAPDSDGTSPDGTVKLSELDAC